MREVATGKECVAVWRAPAADPSAARVAIELAHRAHSRIDHPVIAPACHLDPSRDYALCDCAARVDLAGLLAIARGPEPRIRHSEADGFIVALRDALFAAAEQEDPRDGGPCCIGTVGYGNVLFAPDGRFWLLGLGHNLPLADEHGRIGGRSTAFHAPEVAVGARSTKSSDFVALLLFARSLLPFMVLERSLVRIIAGNSIAEDLELLGKLVWFERRVVTAVPPDRASIEEAIATSNRIRQLLRVEPDVSSFHAAVAAILGDDPRLSTVSGTRIRVADDGSFVESNGARALIPGRGPLRRLVRELARARIERPGSGMTVAELFEAGWPGERAAQRSARNRVHVAVSTLRKLAFASELESHAGAYRISPSVTVELAPPDADSRLSAS